MSIELFQDLINIANALDEAGFTKEAAEMDELLEEKRKQIEHQSRPYYHTYETPSLDKGLVDFIKRMFNSAVSDPNKPGITSVVLKDIYTVLDEAATRGAAETRERNLSEQSGDTLFVAPNAITLAQNLATLEVDLAKMQQEAQDPNMDDLERNNLQRDIEKYQQGIELNTKLLEELRVSAPQDYEAALRYIDEKKRGVAPSVRLKPDLRQQREDRRGTGE